MITIVLNNGTRITTRFELKDKYTAKEAKNILINHGYYLAQSMKRWPNVHDYYCVLLNEVIDRSKELKEIIIGRHLYLMKNQNGLTKIGRSNYAEMRREQIEFETGFNVKVIHVFKKAGQDEKSWHRMFKDKRCSFTTWLGVKSREWFNLTEEDISTIFNNYEPKRQ